MTCWMQPGLILGYYISFEAITSGSDKDTLYNLLNERDKVLKVWGNCVLKNLGGPKLRTKDYIIKQKIRSEDLKLGLRSKVKFEIKSKVKTKQVLNLKLRIEVKEQAIDKQKRKSHSILDNFQFTYKQNSILCS